MFASSHDENIAASEVAGQHMQIWEQSLGLRIHLQKAVDLSNKLPLLISSNRNSEVSENLSSTSICLENMLVEVMDTLEQQNSLHHPNKGISDRTKSKKRLREKLESGKPKENCKLIWGEIIKVQEELKPKWKATLEKWHARVHFGSEHKKSKLKVFNQSIWEHVSSRYFVHSR